MDELLIDWWLIEDSANPYELLEVIAAKVATVDAIVEEEARDLLVTPGDRYVWANTCRYVHVLGM